MVFEIVEQQLDGWPKAHRVIRTTDDLHEPVDGEFFFEFHAILGIEKPSVKIVGGHVGDRPWTTTVSSRENIKALRDLLILFCEQEGIEERTKLSEVPYSELTLNQRVVGNNGVKGRIAELYEWNGGDDDEKPSITIEWENGKRSMLPHIDTDKVTFVQ